MIMENLELSAPWERFYSQIGELFKRDREIRIELDKANYTVRLYVDGERKAEALEKLLPTEKVFGNVTVKVEVVPANTKDEDIYNLYRDAFKDNPVFIEAKMAALPAGGTANYIIFRKEVVQFYNDNLKDPNGLETTLYETIADEVLERQGGEFYSTSEYEVWRDTRYNRNDS